MKLRALPLGLLCAALSLGPVVLGAGGLKPASAADPPAPVPPVRIMLGGDSLTQGFDGDYTWRYRLDREFRRQGAAFNFVGPRKYTYGGANHYQAPCCWDTDHDATGGTRLAIELDNIITDMATADPANPEDPAPDVLVELYGTTDLLPRSDPSLMVSVNDEIDALREYILRAREVRAEVDIVLGEVTTRRITNRVEFNNKLAALAASETANPDWPDSRVVVADLDFVGWDPSKYTYDSTHPNPVGEALIAQRVGEALFKLGAMPQKPAIATAGLRWAPPWAPKIRVSSTRRLVLDWSQTKFLNKPQMMRFWTKSMRTGKVTWYPWTRANRYVTAAQKPGWYKIRVQGRRQAMISPWSKTWTVVVRR